MVGFLGQSENSIDDKGRVALPARMRRELSPDAQETFVASRGIEKCITLVPLNIWEAKGELLRKLNAFNKDNRTVKRKESRWSEVVTLDAQGRINLSRKALFGDDSPLAPRPEPSGGFNRDRGGDRGGRSGSGGGRGGDRGGSGGRGPGGPPGGGSGGGGGRFQGGR